MAWCSSGLKGWPLGSTSLHAELGHRVSQELERRSVPSRSF